MTLASNAGAALTGRLEARLAKLREEFARGRARLEEIEEEAGKLREALLRISGAIQVLTEELGAATGAQGTAP